jgi:phage FluMu protein Com
MQEARCKKCGKLMFKHGNKFIDFTGVDLEIRKQIEKMPVDVLLEAVKTLAEPKCERCKTENQILI